MKTVWMIPLAVGHIFDEDIGDRVDVLASGERVDGDDCLSWSCYTPG